MAAPPLGCIAAKFTVATGPASIWVARSIPTAQEMDVAEARLPVDAVVIALTSSGLLASEVVAQSLVPSADLHTLGGWQCSFKVFFTDCSAVDSAPAGTSAEALSDQLSTAQGLLNSDVTCLSARGTPPRRPDEGVGDPKPAHRRTHCSGRTSTPGLQSSGRHRPGARVGRPRYARCLRAASDDHASTPFVTLSRLVHERL